MNDVLHLSTGQQICADAIVLEGEAEVNESLITGERRSGLEARR